MSLPDNRLAKLRPRLYPDQDLQHRLAAAGLLHVKSFMSERARYFNTRKPETVHQMRVAIRRLRTVLYVLSQVTADARIPALNLVLRDFARILGQARDQDIFIGMLQQIPSFFFPDLDQQEIAAHAIIAIKDKAYLQIDGALQASKLNTELDQLIDIFHNRDIDFLPHIAANADTDARILKEILKNTMKRGRGIKGNNLDERHRLRIGLKRLRYALEFLALNRRHTARGKLFTITLERLLDHLGSGNDAFTAARIAAETLTQQNAHIHLMGGMIAGWHSRAVRDNEADLLKTWQKFKTLKPYWN